MLASLKTSSKISLQNHPNYRVVTVSNRQGQCGMLVPHANVVVPDKNAVYELSKIFQLYEKLKPRVFNYGAGHGYERSNHRAEPSAVRPFAQLSNPIHGLPLFEKIT